MTEGLRVRQADNERDHAAIRELCRAYRDLLAERWPDMPGFLERYYNDETFEALLIRLPVLHRPPKGALLLAELEGACVGCAMTHQIAPGICEIKRVYVSDSARGTGAGEALFLSAMEIAKKNGFHRMVLDTTTRLTEAIGLYRKLGFAEIEPFYEPQSDLAHILLFFGRDL